MKNSHSAGGIPGTSIVFGRVSSASRHLPPGLSTGRYGSNATAPTPSQYRYAFVYFELADDKCPARFSAACINFITAQKEMQDLILAMSHCLYFKTSYTMIDPRCYDVVSKLVRETTYAANLGGKIWTPKFLEI